jgi:hypothetical protein
MLFSCLQTLFAPVYASQILDEKQRTLQIAKSFVGIKEEKTNGGYWVDRFLRSVGLRTGNQWCGAFVGFCLDSAKVTSIKVRSGLARRYVTKQSIKAKEVMQKNITIPSGSILVWRRGNTLFGHVGFVKQWKGKSGTTIEGNTSSGTRGSQNDGDGVYQRNRSIYPLNYFRITDFTIYGKN